MAKSKGTRGRGKTFDRGSRLFWRWVRSASVRRLRRPVPDLSPGAMVRASFAAGEYEARGAPQALVGKARPGRAKLNITRHGMPWRRNEPREAVEAIDRSQKTGIRPGRASIA